MASEPVPHMLSPALSSPDLALMVWLSPSFPVGAFAYSHGLEWAQEAGDLPGVKALENWLTELLHHGAARNDAILFACAHRSVATGDDAALHEVAELALALANCAERRLETVTQGNAFLLAARTSWPSPAYDRLAGIWPGDVAYPVAVASAAAGHGIALAKALPAFLIGSTANLVSASVRLGIIGQTDGQRITAVLTPQVAALAHALEEATLADLGGCAFRSDLAAIRHETQYSRLFRS